VNILTGNIKTAFDGIRAEETLKASTMAFLQGEIQKKRTAVRRFAVALASVAVMILSGAFSYNLYFTPSAYVDVDVNPSIGLTLNRFDRVIGVEAYNDDGAAVLSGVNVRFKSYGEAGRLLLGAIIAGGYLTDDGLISVTVQADGAAESNMLAELERTVAASLTEHHANVQTDIYSVTDEIRDNAHAHHMTPAKYLAITELQAVDPTTTMEGCRGHSIGEIKRMTETHSGNHRGGSGGHGKGRGHD
jgi:hypothetical protein